ncbi:MAG: hypothetical protein EZS28_041330 [Streblomastix strix]|uniref:Uncharacterized protein n=1 Tax=Streblomastix strix TaxID=222440 RepID=A0A5J4TZF0_9EUKA|nr:MAG: hypothetical protein EZS28_041330 [Streblomastix strix]
MVETKVQKSFTGKNDDCRQDNIVVQGVIDVWHFAQRRHRLRLGQVLEFKREYNNVKDYILAVQDSETVTSNFKSLLKQYNIANPNQIICKADVGMVFGAIRKGEQKINSFVLKQIMKKLSIAVAKELKEEPIWGIDKLLSYVKKESFDQQFITRSRINGKKFSIIIRYSKLRLTQINRFSAEKREARA